MILLSHINIIGFRAAVAAVKDKTLRGRPYVIAGASKGSALALDCSPEALKQGIVPGMTLALSERLVKDLIVLQPDPEAYLAMNREIEKVAAVYAPVWENDGAGNIYLDITGTRSLFGSPADCSSRVLNDILEKADIRPAAGIASNKLVSKVATRTIRPMGLIQVHAGTEAEFLAHQDVKILPGMGQKLLRTAEVTGIKEIGEIAALSEGEAVSLFGKYGAVLRNNALGFDDSPISQGREKKIWKRADFPEAVIDYEIIRGAIISLAEHGGMDIRKEKLGTRKIRLGFVYGDGLEVHGQEVSRIPLVLDRDIIQAAERIFHKTVLRRIRIHSLYLCFEELTPLGYQPDLFETEAETKTRNLQLSLDSIKDRHGSRAVMSGAVLAASVKNRDKPMLPGATT